MAFNFGEFLLGTLTGVLTTVGESKLEAILQDLHDSNEGDWKAAITGGNALITHLQPLVTKSKTGIDDAIVAAISEAIQASAAANGFDLNAAA